MTSKARLAIMSRSELQQLVLDREKERDEWRASARYTNETVRVLSVRLGEVTRILAEKRG